MEHAYAVDADIARASTLPSAFYRDPAAWDAVRERVFARSWQWLGDLDDVASPRSLSPRDLLPGLIDVPLLLARDGDGTLRCLSNVCTHRGNLLVREPCHADQIRCGYHSRRFDLAGRMMFMPEFEDAESFPARSDDLPEVALADVSGFAFASIDPAAPPAAVLGELQASLEAMPVARLVHDGSRDRDYVVNAHWAIYVENYLEGFHIPFAHPGLNKTIDYASYATVLHRHANVQIARALPGTTAFPDAHPGSPRIAAHYWWIFPNLMVNIYPWGLSINLVLPQSPALTRVAFRTYVWDASRLDSGAGAALDRVEHEDEAIVEAVQRGLRSRLYVRGRYSPTRERGVHHFHRLLCEALRMPVGPGVV